MKSWLLSKLLRRNTSPEIPLVLPEDVVQSVQEYKQAFRVAPFIDWANKQPESRRIIELLLRSCAESEWCSLEMEKLSAFDLYYSGKYREAYELTLPRASGKNFDSDYFGVACMSLFNVNRYAQAYQLLRSIKKHESVMLGNTDYLLAASIICWAVGDRYLAGKYIDIGTAVAKDAGIITFNAIAMYFELGDMRGLEAAEALLDDESRQHPNFQYCLAFLELARNNYKDGLRMAEARYEMVEAHRYLRAELLKQTRWQGEDITGKTLLIHGEQGLGDMIQTARFFGLCLERAEKVIVECPNESIALLEYNFPKIEFVPLALNKPLEKPYDLWVGTLSLPFVFGMDENTVPSKAGYLRYPDDHRIYWKQRVDELSRPGAPRVGVAWSGYPGHRADKRRSIPWEMFRPMLEQLPEVDFFSVQIVVPDNLPINLHNCTEEMATLSDTAALINEMDLIISVDTSVVHIAGALGKETWMMLPYRYEWRWGLEGEGNSWYDSVKVLRQPAPGAWAPVLSRVFCQRLKRYIDAKVHK